MNFGTKGSTWVERRLEQRTNQDKWVSYHIERLYAFINVNFVIVLEHTSLV